MSVNLLEEVEEVMSRIMQNPQFAWIREALDRAGLSDEDAVDEVYEILQSDESFADLFASLMSDYEGPRQLSLFEGEAPNPLLYQNEHELPRLDPLYEASLIERLQFDGDIPELRTGPLPEGAAPAVPVDTEARSLVAIGAMLRSSSEKTAEKIRALEEKRPKQLELLFEETPSGTDLTPTDESNMQLAMWGSADTDLPEYRRGTLPVPQQEQTPTGAKLAALSTEERRDLTYRALTTTQGRRSAVKPIERLVISHLNRRDVQAGVGSGTGDVVCRHEWTCNMEGGKALQPQFSTIDVAAAALAAGLARKLENLTGHYLLEVSPVNAIADRVIGWAAVLREAPWSK